MKTASIVTMHFPSNYGAVLQAYGLSQYIQKMGLHVSFINYIPEYFVEKNSIWYVGNEKYKKNFLLRLLYYCHMVPQRMARERAFSKFRKNELNLTRNVSQEELMQGQFNDSDFYFCGSDQIWNEKNETIFDPIYFLQFVKDAKKRFSYAASGTISYPYLDKVKTTLLPWLMQFEDIAVREDVIKLNLEKGIDKDIKLVCDPVFLLGRDEWVSLAKKGSGKSKCTPYILVYAIGNDATPYQRARELSVQTGLPVYTISWFGTNADKNLKCTPYEFLRYFSEAEYIVTNSFHGTAFSLIFNRQFWVCDTSIANHRLRSILERTKLSNRFLMSSNKITNANPIQWDEVNAALEEFISHSKNYINKCINK